MTTTQGITAARESWRALEARGLTLSIEPVTGLAVTTGQERPVLAGEVGKTPIEIRVKTDIVHFAQTEITARRATDLGGTVGVHPSPGGVLGYLRSRLGQDIEIGDETFDAAYLITGKPESLAQRMLVPSVRELIAVLGNNLALFACEGGTTRVVLNGVETDAERLGTAVNLAIAGATWAG